MKSKCVRDRTHFGKLQLLTFGTEKNLYFTRSENLETCEDIETDSSSNSLLKAGILSYVYVSKL